MKGLLKLRLSRYFFGFFAIFFLLTYLVEGIDLSRAYLTLFSVNSFLYGFYISPILTGQKNRIDELAKAIRSEANALFDILLKTKLLDVRTRTHIQSLAEKYITASFKQRKPAEGEEEYEALISYCLNYKGKDKEVVDKILANLVSNQQNRSQLAMQLGNKVFSNEWWVMLVLFSVTLVFILIMQVDDSILTHLVKALVCTGVSMLMISLLKLTTLTHKKARSIWQPLDNLRTSRFYRID